MPAFGIPFLPTGLPPPALIGGDIPSHIATGCAMFGWEIGEAVRGGGKRNYGQDVTYERRKKPKNKQKRS